MSALQKANELYEATAMPKMKIAVATKPGGDFEIQEREVPQPGPGHVRIRVQACGICFSDHLVKDGLWPGVTYPRSPGHEVAGVIDEVGSGVTTWKQGQRVGVGWHGGQDNTCLYCRRGDFGNCAQLKVTGFNYDGGYAEHMIAPIEALAQMPDSLDAAAELQKLGVAQVIRATAPSGKAMTELLPGLAPRGTMLVIGASGDPIQVSTGLMIQGSKRIQGWASGIPTDSEDTLRFAESTGIRPMVEKFPLDRVNEAYARMMSGKAQFRVVLTM